MLKISTIQLFRFLCRRRIWALVKARIRGYRGGDVFRAVAL